MGIFLVEDNETLREAVRGYLELDGFEVREFGRLSEARIALESETPELLVLDVMLPDGDGFLFAQKLKARADVPIIFLTARSTESDRITGLELGAEDYVVKPFSPKELVLRVKAVLRRVGAGNGGKDVTGAEGAGPLHFAFGDERMEILPEVHRIAVNGAAVGLTAAEWHILLHLVERRPQIFNRGQILRACLGSIADGSERTVDTHIKNIRAKLSHPGWIETLRGFGYRFSGEDMPSDERTAAGPGAR